MYLQNWVKTIFSTYNIYTKLIGTLDKMMEYRALSSMSFSLADMTKNSTIKVCQDLNKLSSKKDVLINMKYIAESLLKNLPKNYARLIIFKYIENKTFEEIAVKMGVSIRSLFRWHSDAILRMAHHLKLVGIDENKLSKLVNDEKWLLQVYKDFSIKNQEVINNRKVNPQRILKSIYIEYRKSLC